MKIWLPLALITMIGTTGLAHHSTGKAGNSALLPATPAAAVSSNNDTSDRAQTTIARAAGFLVDQQNADGSWGHGSPLETVIVLRALSSSQQMLSPAHDDSNGSESDWRIRLINTLSQSQQANGSWHIAKSGNGSDGDDLIVTVRAILALEEAEYDLHQHSN